MRCLSLFLRYAASSALAISLIACSTSSTIAQGPWTSLFDGNSLKGWRPAAHGKADYQVIDGAIQGTTKEGSPNSFLMSEKEYGDFELEFEVKVDDALNSGVQIRSREKTADDVARYNQKPEGTDGIGRFHGPQVEIESSPGQAGYIYGEATPYGWLSPEPKDEKHSHKAILNGQWNRYRIVAQGPRIRTFINDQPIADLTHEEIYKTHPKGHIGLQVHGIAAGTGPYKVWWRNLRIRELTK
jgi:hypothetical protein